MSGHGTRALKWTLFIQATKIAHKQLGKDNNYREFSGKFGVVASTAYEKVNTTDTEENLFRLVPVIGHGAHAFSISISRQVEEAQVKFKVKGTPFLALTWHCLRT